MSTIELKKRLIDKINSIDNVELLKEASRLIDIETKDIESIYILPENMDEAVSEAKEQISNGNYLTHSEANKEIEKWFEE